MTDPLEAGIRVVLVVLAFLVLPLVIGQIEHKLGAHLQGRLGPMYAGGFHGWAQPVADGIKFAQKADVLPRGADPAAYRLAPWLAVVPYLVATAFLPVAPGWVGADVDAGLVVVVAALSVALTGTVLGGLAGGAGRWPADVWRSAAGVLSCHVAFVLGGVSVAMAAGTLSLTGIVEQWRPWWLVSQAVGGVVFFLAGLAALRRPPFGTSPAGPGAWGAAAVGYSGLRFAAFVFAEFAGLLVLCGLTTVLFLGGWRGPGPDVLGPVWTIGKVFALVGIAVWIGAALPRLREDQSWRLVWRGLLPLAVLQLAITTAIAL